MSERGRQIGRVESGRMENNQVRAEKGRTESELFEGFHRREGRLNSIFVIRISN